MCAGPEGSVSQKKKKIPKRIKLKDGTFADVPRNALCPEKWISARKLIDKYGLPKELEGR